MTAPELLYELQTRGVCLTPQGNRLHVDAPRGELQPSDWEALREHKPALLRLLKNHPSTRLLSTETRKTRGTESSVDVDTVDGRYNHILRGFGLIPQPSEPNSTDSKTWPADDEKLVKWFLENRSRLPAEPFRLGAGRYVFEPGRFYSKLQDDIAAGPQSARAAGLLADLRRLQKIMDGWQRNLDADDS